MKNKLIITGIITFLTLSVPKTGSSKENRYSGKKMPYFTSLGFNNVKSYVGPNIKYPLKYTYHHKHTPLKVINEFYNWRQVEDINKKQSWIFKTDLSNIKTATITKNTILFDDNNLQSEKIAKIQSGAIVKIKYCENDFCYGTIEHENSKIKGYILQNYLWGDLN